MARRPGAKTLGNIQLTPEQYAAVQAEASRLSLDVARYVRNLLVENVPGFTDDIPQRGTYDRRRQYIGWCISDDDEVVAPDVPANAWMDAWYRDDSGEKVPAVYNLLVGDAIEPKPFDSLVELLDAMANIAPFEEWRVEGENCSQ